MCGWVLFSGYLVWAGIREAKGKPPFAGCLGDTPSWFALGKWVCGKPLGLGAEFIF